MHTDLAITGKPAQFGRGVMQDVSDKLLGQFVACLEQRLGEDAAAGGGESSTAAATGLPRRQPTPPRQRPVASGLRTQRLPHLLRDGPEAGRRARPRRHRAADPGEDLLEAGPGVLLLLALVIFLLVR